MRKRLVAVLYLLVVVSVCGFAGAAWQQQDARTGTDGIFTMALAGDAIITERLSPFKEPEFLNLITLIRGADAAFANFEMLLHDYEGYPNALSGGTWMRADPVMAKELAWAGVDIVSRANNHTGDYSPESMRTTSKYLNEAGIVWAGVGENLQQAREAHYLETADGRVALISCASTFTVHSAAGKQRSDVSGRPGLSPLKFATRYIVDQPTIDGMRRILTSLGLPAGQGGQLTFMGNRFAVGPAFKVEQTPDQQDLSEIVRSIKDARALSDYVVVTIHAHEGGKDRTEPAPFLPIFAHAAIDAGADMFVGHGPHVLRGIEIYKGKPILYSVGDFIFQNETVLRLPEDNYEPLGLGPEDRVSDFNAKRYDNDTTGFPADRLVWESVIAMPSFRGGQLIDLKLHPISLGFGKLPGRRGRPMLADEQLSKKIIDDMIRLSKPFGTNIEYRNGIGSVKVAGSER
jgi:poly-gamma-glutamate capsule biosynthesis protein CapA/YwtB (metallophosphatase superfamily)